MTQVLFDTMTSGTTSSVTYAHVWNLSLINAAKVSPKNIATAIQRNSWIKKLTDKLKTFSGLKLGWNGYAADPPNDYAIRMTERFLEKLYNFDLEPNRLAASVVGGIGITFRKSAGKRAYVEIYNNGDIYLLLSTKNKDSEISPERLGDQLIRRIREHIGYE